MVVSLTTEQPISYQEMVNMAERMQTVTHESGSILLWRSDWFYPLSLEEWNAYSKDLEKRYGSVSFGEAEQEPEPEQVTSEEPPIQSVASEEALKPTPCYEMHLCRGNCGNGLHTTSNIKLAKATYYGEQWGDLLED